MPEQVWITVTVNHETKLAILVDAGIEKEVWIPRSQILDCSEENYQIGDTIEIELPEWLANDEGLI